MKKSIPIIIIIILVLSGLSAAAYTNNEVKIENTNTSAKKFEVKFSNPIIKDNNKNYLNIKFENVETYLMNPGQPIIPRVIKKFELPFGVTNIEVISEPSDIEEIIIPKLIEPAPTPLPLTPRINSIVQNKKDKTIYNRDELYPHQWHSHHVGCGLNNENELVTHLTINIFPMRYRPLSGEIKFSNMINIKITYDDPVSTIFSHNDTYDLVIITPSKFSDELQRFVDHKNTFGVKTFLKTTEEIYNEFTGVDKPEQIKYFIKSSIETLGIEYVLLFGGLKSIIYGKAKDDQNQGTKGWYIPVRYSNFQWDGGPGYNFTSGEPGYISDLYYADIYKEGGLFDDWDSNGNGIFAEWSGDIRDEIDLYPDVALGRLAVRNNREAKNVIDKIINYEKQPADPSWFKRLISISGDGFLDQEDWNIQWNTTNLSNGEYKIYAKSSNPQGETGPIDEINITIDKTVATNITFNHDDHLKEELQDGYPAPPIAEIVSISNGNILGNSDYTYTPHGAEAYCNDLYWWANISYINGILTIRGKSYDPKPYGNITNIKLWINNSNNETIFTEYRNNTETYYEGEWLVGEKLLRGRGGAIAYMPDDFDSKSVFTSNGLWYDQSDVIEEFSEGCGLAYFSGHGSPGWWGDHYPGIPGNRRYGQVAGLVVTQVRPFFPYFSLPLFPMTKLKNTNKLPVVCVGGCHNSMFSVSLIPAFLDLFLPMNMHTYGTPVPECWGWYMVKLPNTGAIATMGNTGYGWGSEGDVCTIGTGDGWINTEFFRIFGEENQHILGISYSQSIANYITHHKTFEIDYWRHDYGWDGIDEKTVQQWQLLGDPSLKIGGYS